MEYNKTHIKIEGIEEYWVDTNGIVYEKDGIIEHHYTYGKRGYKITSFKDDERNRLFAIHQIVAKTFLPPPDSLEKNQVNHKDGNKLNNNIDNLEWVTPQENSLHSTRILGNGIGIKNGKSKAVIGYDKKTKEKKYEFGCLMDAAKYFCQEGKNPRYIQNIICSILKKRPGRKSYKGCTWEYANPEDADK